MARHLSQTEKIYFLSSPLSFLTSPTSPTCPAYSPGRPLSYPSCPVLSPLCTTTLCCVPASRDYPPCVMSVSQCRVMSCHVDYLWWSVDFFWCPSKPLSATWTCNLRGNGIISRPPYHPAKDGRYLLPSFKMKTFRIGMTQIEGYKSIILMHKTQHEALA